ncbi:MAG: putative Ig domain-containing protein, partial [Anaerolineae bacterium]|nr:putative Ig domain-containing protein [Thermoflexales bacterium]MDW8409049.1 putative Ig domain-containing protein [Anaerolineae bacterium]
WCDRLTVNSGGEIKGPTSGGGGCPTVTVGPASLPNGTVGTSYSQTLTASGGTGPYTFTVASGTLPPGLALAAGGALAGTPTTVGTYTFTARAADAQGCVGTREYALTVGAACPTVTVEPVSLPNGTVRTSYSQTLTASGGTGPYTFTVVNGTLPAGLTLGANGTVSGTPTVVGTVFV